MLPAHVPLPAKIRTELLDPIEVDDDPERADDEAYVQKIYDQVQAVIQAGMDRLAAKRNAAGPRLRGESDRTARYEYKVEELREGMIGGKMSGGKLERVLNEHAREGWQLRAITSVEVKGRIGPGGVEGVLVTFERRGCLSTDPEGWLGEHPDGVARRRGAGVLRRRCPAVAVPTR